MPNILRIIKKTEQRGQGLVEFALVLPLLLLLVWGVIEFGRVLYIYTEVSNAAREAVRYGVARGRNSFTDGPNYLDCEGIRRAARSTAVLTGLPDSDFQIGYDRGGGSTFATCEKQPADVHFGDRLVITVTHEIEPLVLLRDTGSLRVMFATARTIVEEGIPVDGETPPGDGDDDGDDDNPIGDSPEVTFVLDDPFACHGHLEWTAVPYADSYIAYQTVPTPTQELANGIVGLRYPETGSYQAEEGEEYAVRGFNEFGRGPLFGRDVVVGCSSPAETEDLGLVFTPTVTSPSCAGYFSWRTPPNATGFYLYGPDDFDEPFADVPVPRFPITDTEVYTVANGEKYVVTVYNESGEGLDTALTIGECPGAPEPPDHLEFVPDQKTPPCMGHLDWNHSTGADWYEVYRDGELIATQVPSSRYPSYDGTIPDVDVNQVYTVTAVNVTDFGVYPSEPATAQPFGCYLNAGEVDVRYFLHSVPSPPVNHTDAQLPFFMTEEEPAHGILYNYNDPDNDPVKPGREVLKGGGTPPGEADPQRYIEWRTAWDREHYPVPLTIKGDVTVTLWAKNPANQQVVGRAYLYELSEGGYTLIAQTYHTWAAGVIDWQPVELRFAVSQWPIRDDGQLVVWLISDNAKSLHFAYDTTVYPSKIGFTGRWDSE
jgi:hypothetical protein